VSAAAPGRVLRLSILAWGLGELAMGRRYVGSSLLLAQAVGLAIVALLTWLLADTTWYLVPFVAGMALVAIWALQAVVSYRRAHRLAGQARPPTERRSPAAAAAWLTLPLLAWGTGFWLFAAHAASPAAVVDRLVSGWGSDRVPSGVAAPAAAGQLSGVLASATSHLRALCAAGSLSDDCADGTDALLHDVRVRVEPDALGGATATAEVVRFERRPTRFLGVFAASELVAVPVEPLLQLRLAPQRAALGAQRWAVVNATLP
jgi:hypothetical protein